MLARQLQQTAGEIVYRTRGHTHTHHPLDEPRRSRGAPQAVRLPGPPRHGRREPFSDWAKTNVPPTWVKV